jgi:glycosyltransferase involved in cell wall biosynthesis
MRSLEVGGAERLVLDLAKKMPNVYLITLYGGAFEYEAKETLKERLIVLNGSKLQKLKQWIEILNTQKPDIVYAHLGEAQLLSLIAKFYGAKAVWCLHSTNLDWSSIGKVGKALFGILAKLAHFADAAIPVCNAALEFHAKHGYKFKKHKVIFPGVDTEKFCPKEVPKKDFFSVGISARLDPIKGYDLLAKAAKIVLSQRDDIRFFSAGSDNEKIRLECEQILGDYKDRFIWLGRTSDMCTFYNSLDAIVSSSYAEAFSIAILEAMACDKTVVATDVGNSALIVGDGGLIVLPNDANALAEAIINALTLKLEPRERIKNSYSLESCAKETQKYLEDLKNEI